ncbi:MAG: BatD family protein [Spirochaetaceae bacterium]|nr:BatD family protein [Spirochaetaceae bacterium]
MSGSLALGVVRSGVRRRLRGVAAGCGMVSSVLWPRLTRAALVFTLVVAAVGAGAQEISVRAAVDRQAVDVGDPFRYQIAVGGTDQVTPPDLGSLRDFTVRPLAAGPNNSESVTVINGNTTREVRRGYVMTYQLTANRAGTLTIPALPVIAGGAQRYTPEITVEVNEPGIVDGYRLHLALDKGQVWVGQPVVLTTTWMWDPRLGPERFHQLSVPLFDGSDTGVTYEHRRPATLEDDPVRLEVSGQEVIWQRGEAAVDGESYRTLSFTTTLIPQRSGELTIPKATLVFEGIAGFRNTRDVFGRAVRQAVSQRFVLPSNELALQAKPLPDAGRPGAFTGLVGEFTISAEAAPLEVKVGDPIDLTVTISGSGDLRRLPPLDFSRMDGFEAFRIGDAPVAAATFDRAAIRRTLRALSHHTTAIPPVRIVVFDAASGRYVELASEAIPLSVLPTRQVTMLDVEGDGAAAVPSAAVASREEGIAHNYSGARLLKEQRFDAAAFVTSPGGLAALLVAPLLLAGLSGWAAVRRRRRRSASPAAALSRLRRALEAGGDAAHADPSEQHLALRSYLADRFAAGRPVHGFADVAGLLRERGVSDHHVEQLRFLFAGLEAARYGGGVTADVTADLRAWAADVEEELRR